MNTDGTVENRGCSGMVASMLNYHPGDMSWFKVQFHIKAEVKKNS